MSTVEIIGKTRAYNGFFKLDKYLLRHSLFSGGSSETLERELFERGHAVAVLPYDPVADCVLLVEQFRIGALQAKGGPWLLEIVAGMIEAGETPAEVARREALEEAACELAELVPVHHYFSSPGGSSEQVSVFCARARLEGLDGGIHGNPEEGEDIRVQVVSFERAAELLETGIINSAAPIIALQWLTLNRDRLRDRWS